MSGIESAIELLGKRLEEYSDTISTEEATKTSIIMPFLQALGYDVFNPSEVIPEFSADTPGKKAEKVDYAIRLNGDIAILIECKGINTELDKRHLAQLYRYFSVERARFAILTNGRNFEFYSDLDEPNKLDQRPFFSFDLLRVGASALSEIKKFEKANFDVDRILANAERLRFVSSIRKVLDREFNEPSDALVRLVASEVHEGRLTSSVKENVEGALKSAFAELIRSKVQERLESALAAGTADVEPEDVEEDDGIETTQDEIEGMLIIRSITRPVLDAARVDLRDAKSYCAVLVDDNNRKPLARMHFNRSQWYLGLFDDGKEDRIPIDGLNDIFNYADRLTATASKYVEPNGGAATAPAAAGS